MGTKLAILGHSTRGEEVVELLEMMGGSNIFNLSGNDIYSYYIIKGFKNEICNELYIFGNEDIYHFTLEKFLEKYPFKIGDKVIDEADGCPGVVSEMKWDEEVSEMKYYVEFENGDVGWFANDSIEFCEKNKNLEENKFPSFEPMFKLNDELEYKIPDGYEITEVSKNTVFIKPIKPKYPTTYAECCDKTNFKGGFKEMLLSDDEYSLSISFIKLKRCRDAYWKIAGEQMGLDKPWEPAIQDTIWGITRSKDEVEKYSCHYGKTNLLEFSTEEMRDAFYENFKDLIEQCKELL